MYAETPPPTDSSTSGDEHPENPAQPPAGSGGEEKEQSSPPPPMRAVPAGEEEDEAEAEVDDPAAEREFEADPSLALPGVKEIERPGFRDPEWVNTEEREAERFEPIPSPVETPGSSGESAGDNGDDNGAVAGQQPQPQAATAATTPPAALEAGAGAALDEQAPEEELAAPQSPEQVAQVMEALLFVSSQPLAAQRLRELMELDSVVPIRQAAARLREEYERRGRAFELVERAGGYLLQTRPEFAGFVKKLERERQATRISPAALTTLSIIAYRQPLTRAEVDAIRGVGSSHHIRALMERDLIKVVGRKNVPGNPSLYGTTNQFLLQFGLRSLRDLPQEADLEEVDEQTLRTQQQPEANEAEPNEAEQEQDGAEDVRSGSPDEERDRASVTESSDGVDEDDFKDEEDADYTNLADVDVDVDVDEDDFDDDDFDDDSGEFDSTDEVDEDRSNVDEDPRSETE